MRRPVLAANWKMHKTQAETRAFFEKFKPLVAQSNHCEIVVCPPFTSLGAAVSAVGNIGPGLGEVGPAGNYAGLSTFAKWVFMAGMLLGRLELMTVLVLFIPQAWRR